MEVYCNRTNTHTHRVRVLASGGISQLVTNTCNIAPTHTRAQLHETKPQLHAHDFKWRKPTRLLLLLETLESAEETAARGEMLRISRGTIEVPSPGVSLGKRGIIGLTWSNIPEEEEGGSSNGSRAAGTEERVGSENVRLLNLKRGFGALICQSRDHHQIWKTEWRKKAMVILHVFDKLVDFLMKHFVSLRQIGKEA